MSLSLVEYRAKLINKILFAGSPEDVKRYINAAMKALERNKVNGHIVARFVDKMISESGQFNPIKKDSRQWNNIQMALIHLYRIKLQIGVMAK